MDLYHCVYVCMIKTAVNWRQNGQASPRDYFILADRSTSFLSLLPKQRDAPSSLRGTTFRKFAHEMDLDDMRKKASCMVLSQGAEAIIYSTAEAGRPTVTKHRFRKRYRHPELDAALTATRLKQEVRSILRARRLGVRAPVFTRVDVVRSLLVMQRIDGKTTKEAFLGGELGEQRKHEVARELGRMIATLHDGDLIHGDLTTSNVMIEETTGNVILIDFGLSQLSTLVEDKAVDLYVLERSFRSAHPLDGDELLESLLSSYKTCSKKWCSTMNRLADVRLRGRKRSMVG